MAEVGKKRTLKETGILSEEKGTSSKQRRLTEDESTKDTKKKSLLSNNEDAINKTHNNNIPINQFL